MLDRVIFSMNNIPLCRQKQQQQQQRDVSCVCQFYNDPAEKVINECKYHILIDCV